MKRKRQKKWYQLGEHTMYLLSLLFLITIAATASCGGGGGGGDGGGTPPPGPPPTTGRGSWVPTDTTGAPSARAAHSSAWTGTEMIVWGGTNDGSTGFNTGAKYDPAADSWTATAIDANTPSARFFARARWISAIGRMIIWGGTPDGNNGLNTGGVYNPATDSWSATCDTNAPSPRFRHTTVRNGSDMIVWGGTDGANPLNTGGVYDQTGICNGTGVGRWVAKSNLNAGTGAPSARYLHSAVRRGTPETMIVWGGTDGSNLLNTGGIYDPATDTWAATDTTDPDTPSARADHRAVFAGGTGMIVWGGTPDGSTGLNTGAIYHPNTDTWSPITTANAPSARAGHRMEWTGTELIVWGGTPDYTTTLNTGGVYDPAADTWTEMTTTNAPTARSEFVADWTGTEMIVWGGTPAYPPPLPTLLNTGGRYTP